MLIKPKRGRRERSYLCDDEGGRRQVRGEKLPAELEAEPVPSKHFRREPFRDPLHDLPVRLKVTDESAVGGIFACPKCGSMVEVTQPPAADASSSAPSAARSEATSPSAARSKAMPGHGEAAAGEAATGTGRSVTDSKIPRSTVTCQASSRQTRTRAKTSALCMTPAPPPLPGNKVVRVAAAVLPLVALPVASAAPAASTAKTSGVADVALKYVRQEPWLFGGALAAGIATGLGIWLAMVLGGSANAEPEQPASDEISPAVAVHQTPSQNRPGQ